MLMCQFEELIYSQQIITFTHLHIFTSAHYHISTFSHLHICTPTDPCFVLKMPAGSH